MIESENGLRLLNFLQVLSAWEWQLQRSFLSMYNVGY